MLLVHHDQPEVAERREDRRARPHADACLAAPHPPPLVVALALREARVHDRDRVAEALDEPARRLRRERDLGDEHDRRAAALECRRHRAQVDLGLAAARDPVQEQRTAGTCGRVQPPLDRRQSGRLVGGRARRARRARRLGRRAGAAAARRRSRAGSGRAARGCEASSGRSRRAARAAPRPARRRSGRRAPRAGAARAARRRASAAWPTGVMRGTQRAPRPERARRARAGARRQHQCEAAGRRRDVLARHPEPEGDERPRHVRLERGQRLRQPLRG